MLLANARYKRWCQRILLEDFTNTAGVVHKFAKQAGASQKHRLHAGCNLQSRAPAQPAPCASTPRNLCGIPGQALWLDPSAHCSLEAEASAGASTAGSSCEHSGSTTSPGSPSVNSARDAGESLRAPHAAADSRACAHNFFHTVPNTNTSHDATR